jgi:hypothetical protein
MARPSAELIDRINVDDFLTIEILTAPGLWAVLHKGRAVNLKRLRLTVQGDDFKYMRTTYASAAPANNLAKKLNEYFMCDDFTVVKVL